MTGLLEAPSLVESGQQSPEEVEELLPLGGGEPRPETQRRGRCRGGQGRGGMVDRAVVSMRSLQVIRSDVVGTIRRAQAAPRRGW